MVGLTLVALFAALIAGILLMVALDARRTLERLEPQHRSPVTALVGEEAESMGSVAMRSPLSSPLGRRDCVYYKFSIRVELPTRRRIPMPPGPGAPGAEPNNTRRVEGERSEDFFLESQAGPVLIRTQGAKFNLSSRATRRVGIEELVRTEHPALVQLAALAAAIAGVSAEETVVEPGTELFIAGRRLVDAPMTSSSAERGPTLAAWFIADRPKELILSELGRRAARSELGSKVLGGLSAALGFLALAKLLFS